MTRMSALTAAAVALTALTAAAGPTMAKAKKDPKPAKAAPAQVAAPAAPAAARMPAGYRVAAAAEAVAETIFGRCDQELSQPFLRFGDRRHYTLFPGGDFEGSLDGWTLRGNAAVVNDNEPWKVTDADDSRALRLAAGASATTPALCAGMTHFIARLFTKGMGNTLVEILYPDERNILRSLPLGWVQPTAEWKLSDDILTVAGVPFVTGRSVALRITALSAPVTIDGVYLDPVRRR